MRHKVLFSLLWINDEKTNKELEREEKQQN